MCSASPRPPDEDDALGLVAEEKHRFTFGETKPPFGQPRSLKLHLSRIVEEERHRFAFSELMATVWSTDGDRGSAKGQKAGKTHALAKRSINSPLVN